MQSLGRIVPMMALALAGGFGAARGISAPVPLGPYLPRGAARRELTDEDIERIEAAKAKRARKALAKAGAR